MKVDSVVALEPWPIKLEVISSIADGFSEAKGVAPIPVVVLAKTAAHSNKTIDSTFLKMTARRSEKIH
jgi:hypothetical protein